MVNWSGERSFMNQRTHDRVSPFALVAFAAPGFVSAIMTGNVAAVLPGIYAKYYGLDMAVIGTILLASRIFDAITDPVIGYLSDHTKTRIGPRKPWIIAGYALCVPAVYMLYVPPKSPSALYFVVWFMLVYLTWTMAEIPYAAWQTELSHDYKERTRIAAFRGAAWNTGSLCFAFVPLLPMFGTTDITPKVLEVVAVGIAFLLPVTVICAVVFVPQGSRLSIKESLSITDLISSIRHNKPLWVLLASFMLFGTATGMQGALAFIYIDTYLMIGDKFIFIVITGMCVGLASIPLWVKTMNRFGKHRPFAIGSAIVTVNSPLIFLIDPGPSSWIPFIAVNMFSQAVFTSYMVAPPAMLADVVDYDLLKSGVNRSGQYFSFSTLVSKFNVAIGSGVAFLLLDLFDYDATILHHSASSVFGLKISVGWIPSLLFFLAAVLIWFFPLDERRQTIIKKRIECRALRATTTQ